MHIISVREHPQYTQQAIHYFQQAWKGVNPMIYEDCIKSCINSKNPLPQWYLLFEHDKIIGGAGLITNDFISRMDLFPWLCALYIDENKRGNNYAQLLINRIQLETKKLGFKELNLCTDHIGYYEKFGFQFVGMGYHPWGEASRIYQLSLEVSNRF